MDKNKHTLSMPDQTRRDNVDRSRPDSSTRELFDNRILGEWLSTREAASFLSISPNALRIWVCRGKIRAYKLGRHLRFRLSDLRGALLQLEGGH